MRKHRNPRARLSKQPPPDNLDDLLYLFRDNVARADAFLTAAEGLIERFPCGGDAGEDEDEDIDDHHGRWRNHVAHLLDAAKLAVRAAIHTGDEIDRRRVGA